MNKKTTKSKPARSLKTLPPKKLNAKTAKGVKGGSPTVATKKPSGKGIEITDYSFDIETPKTS